MECLGEAGSTGRPFNGSGTLGPSDESASRDYSSLLEDFVFNFRLRWIYTPGSEMWLVYDQLRRFETPAALLRDQALFFKVVHNFHF